MLDAAIEIDRRDERFVTVGEQRLLLAAARLFLAPAEKQVVAEAQTLGQPPERRGGNHRGLDLRFLALVMLGKLVEQEVGDEEPEHGVAQEFERLIVADAAADVLVCAGRVGHGVFEQPAVAEAIADRLLQGLELVAQPDKLTAPQFCAVALDNALRVAGVVGMNRDANLAERAHGHREQRLRQVRSDDRRHSMRLEQPAHDARFDVGSRPEDGNQIRHKNVNRRARRERTA